MFTGIIQTTGTVKAIQIKDNFARIAIDHNGSLSGINMGDSIAVDGACLTVVKISPSGFEADISGETLLLTTLGSVKPDRKVNLEKSLAPATPMGGHFVTGHVDGTGLLRRKTAEGGFAMLNFEIPDALKGQIAKKGSVAVDGISLTIADVIDSGFTVAVIPHTLQNTTLSLKQEGEKVNIETDILAKYVERFLLTYKKYGISEDFLKEHGFVKGF